VSTGREWYPEIAGRPSSVSTGPAAQRNNCRPESSTRARAQSVTKLTLHAALERTSG
jgi:hypothetical protein